MIIIINFVIDYKGMFIQFKLKHHNMERKYRSRSSFFRN